MKLSWDIPVVRSWSIPAVASLDLQIFSGHLPLVTGLPTSNIWAVEALGAAPFPEWFGCLCQPQCAHVKTFYLLICFQTSVSFFFRGTFS